MLPGSVLRPLKGLNSSTALEPVMQTAGRGSEAGDALAALPPVPPAPCWAATTCAAPSEAGAVRGAQRQRRGFILVFPSVAFCLFVCFTYVFILVRL